MTERVDSDRVAELEREVLALRRALAYEARVVEAHYEGYKTFPKTRRPHAEEQVVRMREMASGGFPAHYMQHGYRGFERELKNLTEDS